MAFMLSKFSLNENPPIKLFSIFRAQKRQKKDLYRQVKLEIFSTKKSPQK